MDVIAKINSVLLAQHNFCSNFDAIIKHLRILRNLCAIGCDVQLAIAKNEKFNDFLHDLLFAEKWGGTDENVKHLQTVGWQLMANMIVNNKEAQNLMWQNHGDNVFQKCFDLRTLNPDIDVMLMIIYNAMMSSLKDTFSILSNSLKAALGIWKLILKEKCSLQFEFLHFIFEEFLVRDGRRTANIFLQLTLDERLIFLDYLTNYLCHDSPNGLVHNYLVQQISKEFKKKSDCILRVSSGKNVDKMNPQEVYALLRCIATASGSELYSQLYATDHSLFLNVSSLLRCLTVASKRNADSIFTPMKKLEQVAPSSHISSDYQSEISYELKTLLVRCIANLIYNNNKNKMYCVDTQLLPTLLECTNMDARNPLIKEWSILAIRNACVGCSEIQQIIANLTKHGPAQNDILSELNLQLGSLRINPNSEEHF